MWKIQVGLTEWVEVATSEVKEGYVGYAPSANIVIVSDGSER